VPFDRATTLDSKSNECCFFLHESPRDTRSCNMDEFDTYERCRGITPLEAH